MTIRTLLFASSKV